MSDAKPLVLEVDGHEIPITHPDKVLFPDDGITKADLARYYARVGSLMAGHAGGRPLALDRYPNGIGEHGFFQKQAGKHFPDWIRTAPVEHQDRTTEYVVLEDAATLVYLAGQNVIVPHVLLSEADAPQRPVEVMVDLDPSTTDRAPIRLAARMLRDLFTERGHEPRVKSSGSRGLHVEVPGSWPDFPSARALAEEVCLVLVEEEPDRFTLEFHKAKRGDRLFLDINRNAYGQHAVAPYAVRALPGAPVAAPLTWDEALDPRWDPRRWTVKNLFRRLAQRDDPWS